MHSLSHKKWTAPKQVDPRPSSFLPHYSTKLLDYRGHFLQPHWTVYMNWIKDNLKFCFRVTKTTPQALGSHREKVATIQVTLVKEFFYRAAKNKTYSTTWSSSWLQDLSSILPCFTNLASHTSSLTGTLPMKAFWILTPLWADMVQVTRWSTINANHARHIGHCSSRARDPKLWHTELLSMCK